MILPGFPKPLVSNPAPMPEFIAAGAIASGNAALHTYAVPPHNDGDLLVAVISTSLIRASVAPPTGWNTIVEEGISNGSLRVLTKIAASESSTVQFSWATAANTSGLVMAFRGASSVAVGSRNRQSSTTGTALSETFAPSYLMGCFFSYAGRTVVTPPSSMSQLASGGGTPTLWIGGEEYPSAGPTGDRAIAWSGTAQAVMSFLMEITA